MPIEAVRVARWRIMWEQVSRMPNLKCLAVNIGALYEEVDPRRWRTGTGLVSQFTEQHILKPLFAVQGLKYYKLLVSWSVEEGTGVQLEDGPFTEIVRGPF